MNSFYSKNTASFYTFKNILIRPKKKYLLLTNNKNIMSEHNLKRYPYELLVLWDLLSLT